MQSGKRVEHNGEAFFSDTVEEEIPQYPLTHWHTTFYNTWHTYKY